MKDSTGHEVTVATDIANLQSLKYRGYVYDRETGLYFLQSRYYDPVTHRFINADGLVSTGTGVLGYNMFAYCENCPMLYSDPSGNHASNFTCGDPTCIQCNPFRREFLQSQKGIRQYNKCNGTYYIGMDDNGNFISNEQIIASQYWASLSAEINDLAVPLSTLFGSVGYSALGTSYLGCSSTPFSCLSHLDNPYLTESQKGALVTLEIGTAAAGVAFAVIIANLWNPVGWAALAVTAAGIGLAAFTSYSLTQQEIAWENANKEKWGCYYW